MIVLFKAPYFRGFPSHVWWRIPKSDGPRDLWREKGFWVHSSCLGDQIWARTIFKWCLSNKGHRKTLPKLSKWSKRYCQEWIEMHELRIWSFHVHYPLQILKASFPLGRIATEQGSCAGNNHSTLMKWSICIPLNNLKTWWITPFSKWPKWRWCI